MSQWPIVGQFTVEADTPDEAIAWLKAELIRRQTGLDSGVPTGRRT